jgi:hypothetical protein
VVSNVVITPTIKTATVMDNHHKMVDFTKYISTANYGGQYFEEVITCPADREVVCNPQFCAEYAQHIFSVCKQNDA